MHSLKNVVALMGGLLLLSQGATGATVLVRETDSLTCNETSDSPLKDDCIAALANVKTGQPDACTQSIRTEYSYKPVGTCTIQTFSSAGNAHCLSGDLVKMGGEKIWKSCTLEVEGRVYTGGQYKWSAGNNGDGEGVRFIKASK